MKSRADTTLWFEIEQGRYFLLPNNVALLPGDSLLVSLSGDTRRAYVTALEQWEVSAEEVNSYLQRTLQPLVVRFQDDLVRHLPALQRWLDSSAQTDPAAQALEASVQDGLARLAEQGATFLEAAISDDVVRRSTAFEHTLLLQELAKLVSLLSPEIVQSLPEHVHQWYQKLDGEQQGEVHEVIELARQLSRQLEEAAPPQAVEQTLVGLSRLFQSLFGQEAESDSDRQARYAAMARSAIQEARRDAEPFDFKKLWANRDQDNGSA